jgi:hypothetical protein
VTNEKYQEHKSIYSEKELKDNPDLAWSEESEPYRVCIVMRQRDLKPMYHYTSSYQRAVSLRWMIQRYIGDAPCSPKVREGLHMAACVFRVTATNQFFAGHMVKLYVAKRREAKLYKSLQVISREIKRLAMLEEWELNMPQISSQAFKEEGEAVVLRNDAIIIVDERIKASANE